MEVVIVIFFIIEVQIDEDCGLFWVDILNKENKVFLFEDILRLLIIIIDDLIGYVLWLFNFDNVQNVFDFF